MIISHKHKFIFFKTEKTAGTSLEIALSEYCGPEDIITTIAAFDEKIRMELNFRGPQNYIIPFKKYTIKNWSELLINRKRKKVYNHISVTEIKPYLCPEIWNTYYKFCFERNPWDKVISWYYWYNRDYRFKNISEFIESGIAGQIKGYNLYTVNDNLAIDKVFKFEELSASLNEISETLKFSKPLRMPEKKAKGNVRKNRCHYREFLTEKEAQLISNIFKKEINLNNYKY